MGKKSDLRKAWRDLKKTADSVLKNEVKTHAANLIKDTTMETLNVRSVDDFKQKRAEYVNMQIMDMGFGGGVKSSFDLDALFPTFNKGFGPKLDTYCKAAEKTPAKAEAKRKDAEKVAAKYLSAINGKIGLMNDKGLGKSAKALKACADWLDGFVKGTIDHG